jgi:hypothetical protein
LKRSGWVWISVLTVVAEVAPAWAEHPWMNASLSPDQRADLVLKEMTLDEKIDLMHGQGMPGWKRPMPKTYLGNQWLTAALLTS